MSPLSLLGRYPLFSLLKASPLDALSKAGQELTFATGETVFQEGSVGVSAYLVLEGRLRILRPTATGREVSLAQVGPGELVGDYALLPPHRNTATCRAATPARLFRLPLPPLQAWLATLPGLASNLKDWFRLHALLGHLRQQAFLGFLSAPSALAFLDHLRPVTFRPPQTIQADGLGDDCWYFIESGRVCLHPPDGRTSGPPRELGPGDCFGERALAGWPGLPVAVAQGETRCLCLTRDDFTGRAGQPRDASLQTLTGSVSSGRQDYPWVGQEEAADCGLAALAMVTRFHRLNVPVEVLRRQIELGDRGASLAELQRVAAVVGLLGLAVRVGAEQLGQVMLPAIAHCQGGHYVVLYEFGGAGVVVGDPAAGLLRMSQELFTRTWSGHLLLVRPPN